MDIMKVLTGTVRRKLRGRSIAWYCGKTWEPWSPRSLEEGVAGSQSAVIFLSREWAKLGYEVKVYNNCSGMEGVYDKVEYLHYEKFPKEQVFDVLIIWRERSLGLFDENIRAGRILLELQDIPFRRSFFAERKLRNFDKIIVKSRYHRNQCGQLGIPRGKFRIIPNGVDSEYAKIKCERNPHKLIYASNYQRGLEFMLKYGWPIIKSQIPEAELHIFYGWGFFDAYKKDMEERQWKESMVRLMQQPGIIDHGRVGMHELIEEKASSSIHYYGCVWPETDCISVRESALVGCVPVTTKYAALAEKPFCVKVSGNPADKRTQERVADKVVELLKDKKKLDKLALKFSKSVRKESWHEVAKLWLREF